MTVRKEMLVQCPECKTNVATTIFESLDVESDPQNKDAFLKGNTNLFQCKGCSFEAYFPAPFMYHDRENKIIAQCFPFAFLEEDAFFGNFTDDGKIILGREDGAKHPEPDYFKDVHIVFSMEELVRYVTFRDRLREVKGREGT
ncbi:MAG: hypothetical protein GTN70_04275 [Deltaproteobacteria bacterium]|nr:hypothetical protein [Deltaproteobacteria bacterium]NIS76886.1 hypothetical protein [Deltaproteobacteria bacterium]